MPTKMESGVSKSMYPSRICSSWAAVDIFLYGRRRVIFKRLLKLGNGVKIVGFDSLCCCADDDAAAVAAADVVDDALDTEPRACITSVVAEADCNNNNELML